MKKNKKQKDDFRKELDAYQAQGISLWLDGEPSSPKEIWKAHKIAEDISYMRLRSGFLRTSAPAGVRCGEERRWLYTEIINENRKCKAAEKQ